MIRTIIVFTHLFSYMVFSIFGFSLYPIFLLFGLKRIAYRYTLWLIRTLPRSLLFFAGARVTIYGGENLPEENTVCFVSNHQGMGDILVIVAYIPKLIGFIAKKELKILPIINLWMQIMHCIFIDRSSIRQAAKVIDKGASYIRRGYPLVVFPEGTRSRSSKMGTFKRGSIKLAIRSNALIVPLSINGTYKLYEEQKQIRPAHVTLTIHPVIDVSALSTAERKQLSEKLYSIIKGGLR